MSIFVSVALNQHYLVLWCFTQQSTSTALQDTQTRALRRGAACPRCFLSLISAEEAGLALEQRRVYSCLKGQVTALLPTVRHSLKIYTFPKAL